MKRKNLFRILCLILVLTSLLASIGASAASKVYLMKTTANKVTFHYKSGATKALNKGAHLAYWGKHKPGNSHMLEVLTSSGATGYVFDAYLTKYGAFNKSSIYRTTSTVNVYNSSLRKKGTLSANKFVLVQAKSGGWAYVKTTSGRTGYVRTSSLKKVF